MAAAYTDMNANMNMFYDIPLDTPQSDLLPILPVRNISSFSSVCTDPFCQIRASFSVTRGPDSTVEASFVSVTFRSQKAKIYNEIQLETQGFSDEEKENVPPSSCMDSSILTRISPLDALPLNIKSLGDSVASDAGEDEEMYINGS